MDKRRRRLGWGTTVMVAATVFAAGGCGGGGEGQPSGFAAYWADGTAWCAHLEGCTGQPRAQCLASWASAAQTQAAITSAGLSDEDLGRCETAVRLLDQCSLALTCAQIEMGGGCTSAQDAFQTNCSLVMAAVDVYFTQNPATPVIGPFEGTYEGSEAGTFTGSIYVNGGAIADVDSPSAGDLPAAGRVMPNGAVMLSSMTTSGGSTLTVTFSGTVQPSGAAEAFTGSGTWQSTSGFTGSWTLQSVQ